MTESALRDWSAHLPAGLAPGDVDLAAGASLPGAWTARWREDAARVVLSTLDGVRLCAAEFEELTRAAARRYAGAGLGPGDRVLICAETSLELVLAYVGALRAGLTVVPANPSYPAAELSRLASAAQPSLAVLDNPSLLPTVRVTTPDLASLPTSTAVLDQAAPDDVALIVYTSGTTGTPKGVPLTHANLLASAHAVRIAWRWEPDDVLTLCLPLFHVHGLGVGLHGTLTAGAGALLVPRFDPALVADSVPAGASMLFGVPTMYHRLASSPYLESLRGLRLAVSGSAPLAASLHEAVRAGSGLTVLERYGMTETVMLVSNPYEGERRAGTVGFPLPGVSVRLAPREGGTAEIEVRGPNVISGYLGSPAATAAAFTPDGWFRTGDLGTVDEDGYLSISGRAKELIITGGYNVYPREVEEVLRSHPLVADAAVVGAASEKWGETVMAFVVPTSADPSAVPSAGSSTDPAANPSADSAAAVVAALEEFAAENLVPYKRPREWRVVSGIPRNALGKILRHELVP